VHYLPLHKDVENLALVVW